MLSMPESSGSVSLRMPGGEKSMDASLVPIRLLLGVSGAEKLSSLGAQFDARLFLALLFPAPEELIPVVFNVGE